MGRVGRVASASAATSTGNSANSAHRPLLLFLLLAVTACADTVREAPTSPSVPKPLCVLEVQPQMKVVTLAEPDAGEGGGATSLFLSKPPAVEVGDLIELKRRVGSTEPTLEILEKSAAQCAAVVKQALHHHAQH